jgi:hypothetical protein
MTNSLIIRLFALSRVALGLWLTTAPGRPGTMWFGEARLPASTDALIRSVGARDIALGLGLAADPTPASLWLRAGILADAVDTVAAVIVRERIPRGNFFTGFVGALAYAVFGMAVAVAARNAGNA